MGTGPDALENYSLYPSPPCFQRNATMSRLHAFHPEIPNVFSVSLGKSSHWDSVFVLPTSLRKGWFKDYAYLLGWVELHGNGKYNERPWLVCIVPCTERLPVPFLVWTHGCGTSGNQLMCFSHTSMFLSLTLFLKSVKRKERKEINVV